MPDRFTTRYGPFILPMLYTLLAWIAVAFISGGDVREIGYGILLFAPLIPYFAIAFVMSFFGEYWALPCAVVVSQILFTVMFALGTWRGRRFATRDNKLAVPALSCVAVLGAVAGITTAVQYYSVFHPDPEREVREESKYHYAYSQAGEYHLFFEVGNEFVPLRQTPSLRLEHDRPKLDGAIALWPVYGAAARAIYVKSENGAGRDDRKEAVQCTNTPSAYERLISGETDMIFAAAPSADQQKLAAEKGVGLTLTPIAREAFVFLTHEQNPVKNLSVDQIRAIYSGKINHWKEVGGPDDKILAFQRNKDSGSQTTMERTVMRDAAMRTPLEAEYHSSMGGIIRAVADYRNYPNALGYSFRYYATAMNTVPGVALLSVDGIAPTPENIRNGAYPFISDVYIVTARPLSENAQKLRDWFLGDEGQQLIVDVGYVPIRPPKEPG
ncbi:MAG: substrate-binding domain-containing protein [Candidatus Accumulibacter sp.]|nr:substrate-binding domain-containing protein [Accumulibacter sp.]